jgi:hypothetical protein
MVLKISYPNDWHTWHIFTVHTNILHNETFLWQLIKWGPSFTSLIQTRIKFAYNLESRPLQFIHILILGATTLRVSAWSTIDFHLFLSCAHLFQITVFIARRLSLHHPSTRSLDVHNWSWGYQLPTIYFPNVSVPRHSLYMTWPSKLLGFNEANYIFVFC